MKLASFSKLYLIAAVVFVGGLLAIYYQAQKAETSNQNALAEAAAKGSLIAELRQLMTDRETGQRGYLITGAPLFLQPYRESEDLLQGVLEKLEGRLDRPSFERLKLLVGQQFNHLQETISFKDAGREAEAEALVLSGRGKQLMDEVRRISQRELEISQAQLESTRKDLEVWSSVLRNLIYASVAVLVLILTLSFVAVDRLLINPLRIIERQLAEFARGGAGEVEGIKTRIDEITHFSTRVSQFVKTVKQADRALFEVNRTKQQYLADMIEAVPDALIVTDYAGSILRCNKAAEALFGYEATQLIGQQVEVLLPVELGALHKKHRERFLSNPVDRPMRTGAEFFGQTKDGKRVPLTISLNLFNASDAKQIILSLRDVTEIKETQQQLEKSVNDLRSVESKRNQIFGMVAHELRTPVAAISMMAQQHDDDEWLQDRDDLKRTARDLLNTIDDMRMVINPTLARPIRSETFTVQQLNASVAANVASIVSASGVRYEQANAIPMVFNELEFSSDTYRVRSAVTNVVKNACIHSQGDKVWMISRLYMGRNEKQYLEWLVMDNGVGIPEDEIERLFRSGERGKSKAEGSGLGLFITKSWIEEIGGKVEYRRRSGGGSCFGIRVPLVSPSEQSSAADKDEKVQRQKVLSYTAKLNVLFVEDEIMLRMLGQKLLSTMVNDIDVAVNGVEGLSRFDPAYHNIVMTDYFMPEMSGVDMIRQLRADGFDGPIIGVTAATIGEQIGEMLNAGADLVLPKPLTKDSFIGAIAELARKRRLDEAIVDEDRS